MVHTKMLKLKLICLNFVMFLIITPHDGQTKMKSPFRKFYSSNKGYGKKVDKVDPRKSPSSEELRRRHMSREESQESPMRYAPNPRLNRYTSHENIDYRKSSEVRWNREPSESYLMDSPIARLNRYRQYGLVDPDKLSDDEYEYGNRISSRRESSETLLRKSSRASSLPPTIPRQQVKIGIRHATKKLVRELEVERVDNPGPNNRICLLSEITMEAVCKTYMKVHEQVYRESKQSKPGMSSRNTSCAERRVRMGKSSINVYTRKCSSFSDVHLSQGNSPGWVFIYSTSTGVRELKFKEHIGPFEELLPLKGVNRQRHRAE